MLRGWFGELRAFGLGGRAAGPLPSTWLRSWRYPSLKGVSRRSLEHFLASLVGAPVWELPPPVVEAPVAVHEEAVVVRAQRRHRFWSTTALLRNRDRCSFDVPFVLDCVAATANMMDQGCA